MAHDAFEIRTLGDGEKITEPGFYNIPLEQHHSQCCDGVSVTSGILRKLELETPADVWLTHKLNPDRIERKQTDALRLGRIMAAYIEHGPEAARHHVLVLPGVSKKEMTIAEMFELARSGGAPKSGRPSRPTFEQVQRYVDGNPTPAGRKSVEFWKAVEDDPRDEVTAEEWGLIQSMGNVLLKDPAACAALGGIPEITMAFKDEINDLWCLARPDQVSFDGFVSDFKKVSTQGRPFDYRACDRKITDYGYHMQMSFACEAFQSLTGEWPDQVGLIFQTDQPPHHVILRAVDDEELQLGVFQNQRSRRLFRECLDSGNWFGPGEDVGAYQMPAWYRERLIEQIQIGGVAAE